MNDIVTKIISLQESSALEDIYYYTIIHERVAYLLDQEINQLFQLLYRIDIAESSVKNIFLSHEGKEHISKELTLLILERLKQKIELRQKYSSNK